METPSERIAPELESHATPTKNWDDAPGHTVPATPSTKASPESEGRRGRSLSDSWPTWESPLLSPVSWFERSGSFQSFGDSSPKRAHSISVASRESRRIVQQYDAAKTQSLQQHEQFKHSKWGEDRLCEVDFDTSDIDIDLSLAETLKILPFTDTVAQCVRSYSNFLSFRRHKERRVPELPPLVERTSDDDDDDDVCEQNRSTRSQLQSPTTSADGDQALTSHRSNVSPGDVAVPSVVEDAFDTIFSWYNPQSALSFLLSPRCPRRAPVDIDLSCPKRAPGCPKRRGRRYDSNSRKQKSS